MILQCLQLSFPISSYEVSAFAKSVSLMKQMHIAEIGTEKICGQTRKKVMKHRELENYNLSRDPGSIIFGGIGPLG